nr:hypothetical protein [Cystoclonium purpureum f. stellatum]
MCICVNCRHVNNCSTYRVIEKQHSQNLNQKNNSSFIPMNTLIQVNIHKNLYYVKFEWDLVECLSFVEKPGYWLV